MSCPKQNSNPSKKSYLTQEWEKQKQVLIHVIVRNAPRTERSTVMSSFSEHLVPLDFTAQFRLSYNEGEKWLMFQFYISNGSTVIGFHSKLIMALH